LKLTIRQGAQRKVRVFLEVKRRYEGEVVLWPKGP